MILKMVKTNKHQQGNINIWLIKRKTEARSIKPFAEQGREWDSLCRLIRTGGFGKIGGGSEYDRE